MWAIFAKVNVCCVAFFFRYFNGHGQTVNKDFHIFPPLGRYFSSAAIITAVFVSPVAAQ
jgi:hypothetical protein